MEDYCAKASDATQMKEMMQFALARIDAVMPTIEDIASAIRIASFESVAEAE